MKKFASLLIALIALPFAAMATVEIGQPAPDFTGTDSHGNQVKLSELKGSNVVLEWNNNECPFVKKHYSKGDMQRLQETYTAKGVKWLRIISSAPGKQGHVTPEQANAIIDEQGVKATHTLLDESGEIGRLYDAKTTPHMFIIDKDGVLVYAGAIDSIRSPKQEDIAKATPYVANALENLLSGGEIEVSSTQPYGCGVKY